MEPFDINRYDLHTFDIRPIFQHLDQAYILRLAFNRQDALSGRNPDHAVIIKQGSEHDQKIRIMAQTVIDDFICMAINSFEHTWVHRNLKHITAEEQKAYMACDEAWSALYRCINFNQIPAGMFAHYQRVNDSIFLAVPK